MKTSKKVALSGMTLLGAVILCGCGVKNGNVGVKISPSGKVVSQKVLQPGFHPTPINDIVEFPVKMVQVDYNKGKKKDNSIVVSTSDGKRIAAEVKINYHAEQDKVLDIYKKFGNVTEDDMEQGWLRTQTQNALRDEYVKHSLLDILTGKSADLETDVLNNVKERFAKQGYVLDDVTLGVPDVDDKTQETIDSIIASSQANEKAKKDAETALTNAQKDADVAKAKADSDLYTAQKQAEANKKLADSITDELVKYKEAEAHLKHGFVTVQGAGGTIVDGTK